MNQPNSIDIAAITVTSGAPFWVPVVDDVNKLLTTVSLVLGIVFLIWRWSHASKKLED